jgi:hypothetical protein
MRAHDMREMQHRYAVWRVYEWTLLERWTDLYSVLESVCDVRRVSDIMYVVHRRVPVGGCDMLHIMWDSPVSRRDVSVSGVLIGVWGVRGDGNEVYVVRCGEVLGGERMRDRMSNREVRSDCDEHMRAVQLELQDMLGYADDMHIV